LAGRREALVLRAAEQRRPSDGAASPPEAAVMSAERRDVLLAALERLSDDDRAVLACRHLLGLSEDETAVALKLRRGTVKSRTSRALERLRAELGEERP
jgi:RNA polymerase sigma factor (sigma-70 family)